VPKKKLIHFQENLTFQHLFQPSYRDLNEGFEMHGHWHSGYFGNSNPIVIELGCGKGEYTLGLAQRYPDTNFIGIDLKGARLWRGCKTVAEKGIRNVAFVRTLVDHTELLFAPGEVSGIWITFPDPQPKREHRRLTAPGFLAKYRNILAPASPIHLKTDDHDFFDFTLAVIREHNHRLLSATDDLYHSESEEEVLTIRTFYENIWLEKGKKICYLRFCLNENL